MLHRKVTTRQNQRKVIPKGDEVAQMVSYYPSMTVQRIEDSASEFERLVLGEIRAEMARQRISNRQMALRIGQTHYWVGDRLRGKTRLEVVDLQVFADALGVPVLQFLDVRHQGLEPRTRCLSAHGQDPLPILVAVPALPDGDDRRPLRPVRAA